MYLKPGISGYDRDGSQVARRGVFLIMVQPEYDGPASGMSEFYRTHAPRALTRKVALRQLGHWLVGRARILGRTYSVSGAYGHDGLPLTVAPSAYNTAVPIPQNLLDAWNMGGGWNGSGSEWPLMRAWALQTFKLS